MSSLDYCGLNEIHCSRCRTKWLACPLHELRWSQLRYKQAQFHVRNLHSTSTSFVTNNVVDDKNLSFSDSQDNNSSNYDVDDLISVKGDIGSQCVVGNDNISVDQFTLCHRQVSFENYSEKIQRFLSCESQQKGDGMKRIVACAFAMNNNSDFSNLSWDEIRYHMTATMFCNTLSSSQQNQYSDLCYMMVNNCFNNNNINDKLTMSKIPMSLKDIERYYIKRSTSISQNVPIPNVIELDNHAYVSITEVIQYVLFFAIPIDGMFCDNTIKDYHNLTTSSSLVTHTKISNILRNSVKQTLGSNELTPLIIWIIVWSDDFEPNHVKQHKKSTWIKTVTISPPPNCQTSTKHTYIISLGPKDKNHEEVHRQFFKELNVLESPTFMFCKATNSNIPVVVKVLAISADRPERCALNCMLGHGGTTTRRWRYSAYVNQKKLKSCTRCLRQRIISLNVASTDKTNSCSYCYDWDYSHPSMQTCLPSDYPTTQHPNSPPPPKGREVDGMTKLVPIELTFDVLVQGVKFCFFNCYHGYWTKVSAITYLKSIGVNEAYGNNNVYQKAIACRRNKTITERTLYNYLTFPVHWTSGIALKQCIDTPMHQLFQGVVKSIMELTMSWLTKKDTSHYKAFGDFVNSLLEDIHELNLDWCRMEKFMRGRNYTLGGWQAEQYVAFARCIVVVYSGIRDVVGDDEVGIDEHECLTQSLLCFISRFLCVDDINESVLLTYIKIFLSACDAFENKAYIMNNDDAIWYSKGNFLSLLNLPSQVATFGGLRLYWEGSRERSIQQIKPFLSNVRHTSSYFKTKVTHMYINETLDTMIKQINDCGAHEHDQSNCSTNERYSSFRTYKASDDIEELILSGNVISAIYLSYNDHTQQFYICQRSNIPYRCYLFKVSFIDDLGFNKCGMWYAPVEVAIVNVGMELSQNEIKDMAIDYGILCPCLSNNRSMRKSYTVVCKSWKYRDKYNRLLLPNLSTNLFLLSLPEI